MWTVATTTEFDRWFEFDLAEEEREEVAALVGLLKRFGPMLKRPHADTLKGSRFSNMKEPEPVSEPNGPATARISPCVEEPSPKRLRPYESLRASDDEAGRKASRLRWAANGPAASLSRLNDSDA